MDLARPYFDKRATGGAEKLGLPSDANKLGSLAPVRMRGWPPPWCACRWTTTCAGR
ncbi:hypothetical protein I553_6407 [Mycobacterium xenopi 4042]|uniref:Uncharacterized protein n=1 Tax=Mycobacterium xenopi 4042 TaxID=1299334 RepID=X8BEI6_MYCXE|nr:hypothetical protein I553_6407 [Mycobacterium xenopi 4042]